MLRNCRLCILCGIAAAVIALLLSTTSSLRAADKPVSFIQDVAPIFKENCFACHDAKKKSGKYDMTTYEKLMAGGEDGDAITAGKPDDSAVHALMITGEPRRMPPRDKGGAVPKAKAEVIKRWILEGAKLDAGLDANADLVAELRRRWQPPPPTKRFTVPVPVNALAFEADGKHLVIGGHHELTVWEIASGKLVKRLRTRSERAYGLQILPNGLLAVAGGRPGQEGDVRIYDLNAPASMQDGVAILDGVNDKAVLVKHLHDGDDAVLCLALSADGKRLAAGGTDRLLRVWDTSNYNLTATIDNHSDWVLDAAFTADGKYLYSAGRDRTAKVWDFVKKESILTMPEHQAIVYGVAARADGALGFSVGADKMLRAWRPGAESKPFKTTAVHPDEVLRVLMHPTKKVAFTACADKVVRSWEAMEKFPPLKRFEGCSEVIFALALSKDGSRIAAGTYNGEVNVWTSDDAKLVQTLQATPGYKPK